MTFKALILLGAIVFAGCAPLDHTQRPARSSLGCMRAAIRDRVPASLPDKRAHCLATAYIARRCSLPEAYLAGLGKELQDLFDRGDAEWGDLRADAHGARCARSAASDADVQRCCLRP